MSRAEGGRKQMSTGAVKTLEKAIRTEARRFGVSRSFVIHTAVGYALGIDVENYQGAKVVRMSARRLVGRRRAALKRPA